MSSPVHIMSQIDYINIYGRLLFCKQARKTMDYVFPLLAAVLWGANIVITKMASGLISPNEISFLRWFIATLVLTPFVMKPLIDSACRYGA